MPDSLVAKAPSCVVLEGCCDLKHKPTQRPSTPNTSWVKWPQPEPSRYAWFGRPGTANRRREDNDYAPDSIDSLGWPCHHHQQLLPLGGTRRVWAPMKYLQPPGAPPLSPLSSIHRIRPPLHSFPHLYFHARHDLLHHHYSSRMITHRARAGKRRCFVSLRLNTYSGSLVDSRLGSTPWFTS